MSEENVEIVRDLIDAFQRRDHDRDSLDHSKRGAGHPELLGRFRHAQFLSRCLTRLLPRRRTSCSSAV
jgi:hypothetical protein